MRKFILFLILFISMIQFSAASQLFYSNVNVRNMNLTEFDADIDSPITIIMQELPAEFLTNVSYIDSIKLLVCAGSYYNNSSHAPNGKLYFKLYKNVAGAWLYQTGSFFNPGYFDCGAQITNTFTELYIEQDYDYGIGFWTDVNDTTNGSWTLLTGPTTYDLYSGYNMWHTSNIRICNFNSVYVCDPNNIWGYNSNFTLDVNTPKVHAVFPETEITIANGYPNDIGSIYIGIYGQTIITPTPTPTPSPTPTATATDIPPTDPENGSGNYSNYDPDNPNGTYSSVPNGTGFSNTLKDQGFCQSGTCTATDIKEYLAYWMNTFWWILFILVIVRFWSLSPKKRSTK